MSTENTLNRIAKRINSASSLHELLSALREFDNACDDDTDQENEMKYRGVDMTELPTFGGDAPPRTDGIWSWDAEHLLVGDCIREMEIFTRDEWGRL